MPPPVGKVDNFPRVQGALVQVNLFGDSLVVINPPPQGGLVGIELWLDVVGGEEPPFATVQGLGETRSVKVKRDAGTGTGQAEAQGRAVLRQLVRRQLVLVEKLLPLNHVVVAEPVERFWKKKAVYLFEVGRKTK